MSGPRDEKSGCDPLGFHGWELVNMSFSSPQVKGQRRVIFFDAAGTMFHLAKPVGETYSHFARRFGANISPASIDAAFRRAWAEAPPRAPISGPREHDDYFWWKSLTEKVLDSCAEVPPDFDRNSWFDVTYHHYARPDAWVLYDDVLPVLEYLHRSYRLAVISDFDGRLRPVLEGLGLMPFFEHVIISSEVGSDKPDPGIYQHAVQQMRVKPHQCLHVGDDPERDWVGAEAAGLQVFKLKRPGIPLKSLPMCLGDYTFLTEK